MQPAAITNTVRIVAVVATLVFIGVLRDAYFARSEVCKEQLSKIVKVRARYPMETIAFAKRTLRLPMNVRPGVLWRTYMTRLYGLPYSATLEDMKAGQVKRDLRYNLIGEGLPDWVPYCMINVKGNLEQGFLTRMALRHVFSIPPNVPDKDVTSFPRRKYDEYRGTTAKPLSFEEWYRKQVVDAFGLPADTTADQANHALARRIMIWGPLTLEDSEQVYRQRQLEEAQAVLGVDSGLSDFDLMLEREVILQGVQTESPDMPTEFSLFY